MRLRPKDEFIRRIRQEEPPKDIRQKLIHSFKLGGLKHFESVLQEKMRDVSLFQAAVTDPIQHDLMQWIYVGDCWWCRQRKKKKRVYYEFARMVAIHNKEVDGLWDARRHITKQPSIIVYDKATKRRGYVIGYNQWELLVDWEDSLTLRKGVPAPTHFKNLDFEFVEDYEFYKKIFQR